MIKVLVVDDSAFMRSALANMLDSDPAIEVVGMARDGVEALTAISRLNPDIVTLDVEMPRMDGIEALRQIMERHPMPVIMVSSKTHEGAQVTMDALELGAIDFITKDLTELSVNIVRIRDQLLDKIKLIASSGPRVFRRSRRARERVVAVNDAKKANPRYDIVAIGASTGGPRTLHDILPELPSDFPVPIVIAQHMPPNFTAHFAERLNMNSPLHVKEAINGEAIRPGTIYIAPGWGSTRLVRRRTGEMALAITDVPLEVLYRPSVDDLMLSVAEACGARGMGVILTGMGQDGLRGLTGLKRAGGHVIAQNRESCVVYGMPRAVIEAGIADAVVPQDAMIDTIVSSI